MDIEITPELQQKIDDIKQNLTISKRQTSAFLRSKTSATDSRPSAASMGSLGIVAIVLAIGLVVAIDVMNYIQWLRMMWNMIYETVNWKTRKYDVN